MGANKTVTSFLEIPKQKVYKPMVRFYELFFTKSFMLLKIHVSHEEIIIYEDILKEVFMADSETLQHSIKLILHVKQGVFLLEKQVT